MAASAALRPAQPGDAAAIAEVMRASLSSHDWMPALHTPEQDLAFVRDTMLPGRQVTVAETRGRIVGFIAIRAGWVEHLYLDPAQTGQGLGSRLLEAGAASMAEAKLYCFQVNHGARRFYERHGFRAAALIDGAGNKEGLPDILYVRRR